MIELPFGKAGGRLDSRSARSPDWPAVVLASEANGGPKKPLGEPFAEPAWRKIRNEHKRVAAAHQDSLYAIPSELLNSIAADSQLRRGLSKEELAFERALTAYCEPGGWAGVVEGARVCGPIKPPLRRSSVCDAAGSAAPTAAAEDAAGELRHRLEPLEDHAQAYLGWLLSNPTFLAERDAVRARRSKTSAFRSFHVNPWDTGSDHPLQQFLDRWVLAGMYSWDLPIPQGPNLADLTWPASVLRGKPTVKVEVPVMLGLRAIYPIRDVLEESRCRQSPTHLRAWVEITQEQVKGVGPRHFQQMFRQHLYRDLALGARYADRFKGRLDALDRVFGEFLSVGDDRAKRLRLDFNRRRASGRT